MPVLPTSLALALLAPSGLTAPPRPTAVAEANAAMPCQWPTVVSFRAGEEKCTATLVHPRVIVTAAHCIEASPAGAIRFGEQSQPAAFLVTAERCGIHPEFARTHAPSSDLGFCILEEPVDGIPPTPLLTACETAWLHPGLPAVIAGFGITETDPTFGTKRYAFTVLDSALRSDGTIWVGDAEVNACKGDSGGPVFVQSPAGTWHALGVLTHGPDCGQGPMLYRSLHDRIAWLEAETGFDLSPCHDASGDWAPGPACAPIARDPLAVGPSWTDHCAGELVPSPVCPAGEPEPATTTEPNTTEPNTAPWPPEHDGPAACACRAHRPARGGALLLLLLAAPRRRASPRPPSRSRPSW